ncbi:neutral/alkaline non-lysosomal ceramidase N-terminal domain-containing protein [Paludisphaera mucosa]|uniref:Neutral/alkaline non-lysosomal ceramidase N-terminal domain-containing protein n=1 Tax=Paludisphaera mucosa TaxID=3030827 RepID=A0ABT6FKX1_9BACT|nr:neutral/alkaline non-lysosomal ceramidase N-terminal domain-containing protein [Paludisphaera mucosa]MDG3008223.1 neutral/alkaline non-lysosomal ceramidase N-terminal domain-containing protein [Paludisphaera mucosa]
MPKTLESRSRRLRPLVVLIALGIAAGADDDGAAAELPTTDVGAARADVTPDYSIRLSGYGARTTGSVGVDQKIWAKALAIGSDAEGPRVLVSVDNLGVPDAVVEEVAGRLRRHAGIPRERFVVSSSHTHSAPCVSGCADNIFSRAVPDHELATIRRYTGELTDRIEEVAVAALAARAPARLAWSEGRAGFARNRRTRGGPVDHALPVLKATGRDGKILAILLNYACHCTTVVPADNTIHGDWAGVAQEEVERELPGAMALTVIGCGADSDPSPRETPGAVEKHGREIAQEVKRMLSGTWIDLPAPPEARFRRVKVPLDAPPTRAQLEATVKAGGHGAYNASTQLARLDRGEPLQEALDYPVQTWRFGDRLVMVFLAGEVVVDYALRLKTELDASRVWVTAYSNDVPCYIPSERVLREGGYEGGEAMAYYGRPARLKAGVEDLIVSTALGLVPEEFRSGRKVDVEAPPPMSPQDSLRSIRVKPGLRVELVACEPLVVAPVAIDFAADGSLWVCEMRDYPSGMDGKYKPGGVIKRLRDSDGDDRYDTAVNFLENVPFPTGVMAWRNGALICSAPDVIYAEDLDGDGKADLKKVLFTGFETGNYQGRVNGLSYNMDNWIYGANGIIGGVIKGDVSGRIVDLGVRDFRLRPDDGRLELASGQSQSGRVHDDWGAQFGNNNGNWLFQFPMPEHAARRNPWVAPPPPLVDVPRYDERHRLFPISRTLERFNDPQTADHATSSCGPCIYRDTLLGAEYAGDAFVCEPVHNVVHREVLDPDGVLFAGRRADDEQASEFLASTDNWFRPVQARAGPDGALYVVDMYRFVIEHPRWISPDRLAKLDVRAGEDRGRIYRVVVGARRPRRVPDLDRLATPALAEALDSTNGTLRDLVQRVLVHRGDRSAVPALEKIAAASARPEARAQALWALDGLGALTPTAVRAALADACPAVRGQAVRLAEPWLGKDEELARKVLALVDDPDVLIRFQLAMSLGEWDDPRVGEALGRLAVATPADLWVAAAILSSAKGKSAPILAALVSPGADAGARSSMIGPLIATLANSGPPAELAEATAAIARPESDGTYAPWRFAALAEVLDAGGKIPDDRRGGLLPILDAARRTADDAEAAAASRATAVRLIGRDAGRRGEDRAALIALLDPRNPRAVQSAAVRGLAGLADAESAEGILREWDSLDPTLRSECLDLLLSRPVLVEVVLSTIERGGLAASEIGATHRQRLLEHEDPSVRDRSSRVLARSRTRQDVVDSAMPALARPGDAARGREVFARLCAACHRLAGKGQEVGPDLAALTDKSLSALTVAILDPNRDVEARYVNVTAALRDGRVLTGLISSASGDAITLKRQDGLSDVVLRSNLESIRSSGRSLMPEGLENDLKGTDLADLAAFIAGRPKNVEGNRPEMVAQEADGSITLTAKTSEIHGSSLTFETQFENLGLWHGDDDYAAWSIRLEKPTSFTVAMQWACADESAGGRFRIDVGGEKIEGFVGGTGSRSWANYRSIFVGEVDLPAGFHTLSIRPARPLHGAFLDLKSIVLSPRP